MYAKRSKCSFAKAKVEYLRHFISGKGVETDPAKIQAVNDSPAPQNIKQLKSFSGLSGYYRKFIGNYAHICQPLTQLLKKGHYEWIAQAHEVLYP